MPGRARRRRLPVAVVAATVLVLGACSSNEDGEAAESDGDRAIADALTDEAVTSTTSDPDTGPVDITDVTFDSQDPSCAAHAGSFTATVADEATGTTYDAWVELTVDGGACTLIGNGIPNHDFDTAAFATPVAEVAESFTLPSPEAADAPTAVSLRYDNGILLNGVKLDVLAAACYGIGNEPLGREKIGCFEPGAPWRYDPMHPDNNFGTDSHNAHTQPDGAYHYHGDPLALYDPSGTRASAVIGFAADGFPIYGPYIDDNGAIRRVTSGYELKDGDRVSQDGEGAFPGGTYDGAFIDDYQFTAGGDLDECNGMTRHGSYGYYVTASYPWVVGCFTGTPDDSFLKTGP